MIDWKRVDELRDEIGEEGFGEVVELFLDEVEDVVMRLGSAKADSHATHLHFLKGSAWNLGFSAFATACQNAEKKAALGQVSADDIQGIIDSYHQSKVAFAQKVAIAAAWPSASVA